jgi:hypothetical protein
MWEEGGTSGEYSSGGASWLRRAGSVLWEGVRWTDAPGATLMDAVSESVSGVITVPNEPGWISSTDLAADVQKWIDGGAVNQGWFIKTDGGGVNAPGVASSQYSKAELRPKLIVVFQQQA